MDGVQIYSRGWGTAVTLGPAQERLRLELQGAIRHKSRAWHEAPTIRSRGPNAGRLHRVLHRLAALGVIALQTSRGWNGGIRYTFGVRAWRTYPVRPGLMRRWRTATVAAPGQTEAWPADPPARMEPRFDPVAYRWTLEPVA